MTYSHRFISSCAVLMLVSEIWKQWTLTFVLGHGHYNLWYFPFQLCSIPMYVCLSLMLFGRKHEKLSALLLSFLMSFGLLGGIFAFFDTSGMHYHYAPLTIHSYAWHILLIILGCYSGLCKKTEHSCRGLRFSISLYLSCCLIATAFNLIFDRFGPINMFYINPHYLMNQKVFSHIADTFGNPVGILSYIMASMTGAALFHLCFQRICHTLANNKIMDSV